MGAVRKDVRDGSQAETARGGLVYTKKAGWVDLGHARPDNARQFWKQFQCEPRSHEWPNNDHSYVVEFGEQMFAMNLIGVREYDRYR
ncbi:MAG TPA: hypothetical protein VEC37_05315, partial [Bacillota bacterium]|nr:hypothetical protein [Bacillota bacterium]